MKFGTVKVYTEECRTLSPVIKKCKTNQICRGLKVSGDQIVQMIYQPNVAH